ncbi:MAG: hypothetical protein U1E60_31935 [Reyranellaceae bacterium]
MNTSFPSSRRTVTTHPVDAIDDDVRLDGPSAKKVLGEIGVILAIHLAVALAITVTLSAGGIAG